MDKINVALLGAGRIGQLHAENIKKNFPHVTLQWLVDPQLDNTQHWAERMGFAHTSKTASACLSDESLDAVLICSSTDTHADFIKDFAKKGVHIFCEKPVDLDVSRAEQAVNVALEANVILQIGFNRRYDAEFATVKKKSHEIGKIYFIKITSRDPAPPPHDYVKRSGGLFYDMTIHDFDMLRFISGSEVTEVSASGHAIIDPAISQYQDIDVASIQLKMKNEALAVISNSRACSYGYDQRLEVFGEKGMLQNANIHKTGVRLNTSDGVHQDPLQNFFLERYASAYVNELTEFFNNVSSVMKGEKDAKTISNPTTLNDAVAPLLIAKACYLSLKEKRTVAITEVE